MAAVKEVAGASKRGPNINVVEKAQTAVNAIKVASALNEISSLLKVGWFVITSIHIHDAALV